MLLVAIMGGGLALAGQVWHTEIRRQQEKELLFVGNEFRQAIGQYYERSPGTKQYPQKLEDLVWDQRFPTVMRHLRRIYRDPLTGGEEWKLILDPGKRITGVASLSQLQPIKNSGFRDRDAGFEGTTQYSDWAFVYIPTQVADTAAPAPAPLVPTPQTGFDAGANSAPASTDQANPAKNPRKRICDVQRQGEESTCAWVRKRFGDEAGAACFASAGTRYTACLSTDGNWQAPPLAVPKEPSGN